MRIYNSLSGKKEKLSKPRRGNLRLFVCGLTVYDYAHIGHARTYLFFDIFVRYLRSLGWKIFYLQNVTNIDDKIIKRAKKEKKNPFVLARFFEKKYLEDMKKINVTSPNRYARATDFIPEIVRQVKKLIKKGYAYKIADGYYFDIKKFKDYGKLAKRTALQAEDAVSRIDESVYKKNKGDFNLWKLSKAGEPSWKTPLGKGRPGWHIEDTAISEKFFGPQYEIHGGALDLKFPHHEAEIAQQEAVSGKKPFVKIWMHTGFLTVEGQKMSKSLKNFITISDFLKKYGEATLRLIVLKHHYRKPVDYNEEIALQAEKEKKRLSEFLEKLRLVERRGSKRTTNKGVKKAEKETEKSFREAMENDLNTPRALAAIFGFIAHLEKKIWLMSQKEAKEARLFLEKLLKTTGLSLPKIRTPKEVETIIKRREILRRNKQFIQADALRKKIREVGYEIEDTPLGPLIFPKS